MKIKNFSMLLILILCISAFQPSFAVLGKTDGIWNDVAFFGDSTTHGMIRYIVNAKDSEALPHVSLHRDQILTPPNGTFYLRNTPTTHILYQGQIMPINNALRLANPRVLIVTVGVNGLAHWEKESFTVLYNRLLDVFAEALPQSQIFLQSIYPTAKKRAPHLSLFTVERVDLVNGWIEDIAKQRGLLYINTADYLKGEDGWLRSEYQNGDGLHLNTAGFHCVLQTIEAALIQLKGNGGNQ